MLLGTKSLEERLEGLISKTDSCSENYDLLVALADYLANSLPVSNLETEDD